MADIYRKRLLEVRKALEAIPTKEPFTVYDIFPGLAPESSVTNKRLLDRMVTEGMLIKVANRMSVEGKKNRSWWQVAEGGETKLVDILGDDTVLSAWLWDHRVWDSESPETQEQADIPLVEPVENEPSGIEQYLGTIVQVLEGISERLTKLETTNRSHLEASATFTSGLAEAVQQDSDHREAARKSLDNLVEAQNNMRSEFKDYQRRNEAPKFAAVHLHEVKSEVTALRGDIDRLDRAVMSTRKSLELLPVVQVALDQQAKALSEMAALAVSTKQTVQNTAWSDLVNRQSALLEELSATRKAIERVPGINDGRQGKMDKTVKDIEKVADELLKASDIFMRAVQLFIRQDMDERNILAGSNVAMAVSIAGGGVLGPKKSG